MREREARGPLRALEGAPPAQRREESASCFEDAASKVGPCTGSQRPQGDLLARVCRNAVVWTI